MKGASCSSAPMRTWRNARSRSCRTSSSWMHWTWGLEPLFLYALPVEPATRVRSEESAPSESRLHQLVQRNGTLDLCGRHHLLDVFRNHVHFQVQRILRLERSQV